MLTLKKTMWGAVWFCFSGEIDREEVGLQVKRRDGTAD